MFVLLPPTPFYKVTFCVYKSRERLLLFISAVGKSEGISLKCQHKGIFSVLRLCQVTFLKSVAALRNLPTCKSCSVLSLPPGAQARNLAVFDSTFSSSLAASSQSLDRVNSVSLIALESVTIF